ncbi:MAG: S9 family peptidase [Odoribacteraceae bacterium]|jgi:dipeptidyl-peptidase-4|nr:S9 family peptidase [Odoribacteraceae bacterium]
MIKTLNRREALPVASWRGALVAILLLLAGIAPGHAETAREQPPAEPSKHFTLEDFTIKGTFYARRPSGMKPLADGEHYIMIESGGKRLVQYSYLSGKAVDTLVDLTGARYKDAPAIEDYAISPAGTHVLLCTRRTSIYRRSFTAEYYIFDFRNRQLKPLSAGGRQRVATFSPTGARIAFARDNNLFIHDLRFGSELQITKDGKFNEIINGTPDWVYEEEFGFNRAFEWAPDDSSIAYIKFDESRVKIFGMTIFKGLAPPIEASATYPLTYSYKYPKAGEENARVSVHVYNLEERVTIRVDIGEEDIYLPRIRWTTDPRRLAIIRLNRLQNKMEILLANARVGSVTLLYREENARYIAEEHLDNLTFLDDGQHFVISSEKSGYSHLYLFEMSGKEKQAITAGDYDVTAFHGHDAKRKLFYYTSHEVSPLQSHVYSIDLKGKKTRLTPARGWNTVAFSAAFNYYTVTSSSADAPPVTALHASGGKTIRVLENNDTLRKNLAQYAVARREFVQVPAADGKTMLNAWIMKPANFDPSRAYPVMITQYSGPNSQEVRDEWALDWTQYLAQEGFIIFSIDPRGTAARGEEFRKCTYMQLGKLESDDLLAAARWLGALPHVDAGKIAIWGWSYGGFMASLCLMKGQNLFAAAIAVAPVTHFRFYDSIYTERFMRRPSDNPSGYDDNAPLNQTKQMTGRLLLCHGTADDNVHVQNTLELAEALVQANKPFDMQIYTNRDHGIRGGMTRHHLYSKFTRFLQEMANNNTH